MREVGGRVSEKGGRGVTSFVVGSRVDPEKGKLSTGKSGNQSINILSKPFNERHRLFSDICFCWAEKIKGSMDGRILDPGIMPVKITGILHRHGGRMHILYLRGRAAVQ